MLPRKNLGGRHAHSRPSQISVREAGAAVEASTVAPEDGGLPRKDGSSRRLVFDPPAGLLMSLSDLCLEAMLAGLEVGWAFREEVFDQEKPDGGEDSPADFDYPRLQGFYVISYNRLQVHAYV